MDGPVRVRLLGGLRLDVGETEIPVSSTRAGVLLAALVLAHGEVVDTTDLKDLLWSSGEPASAANQLQRLVGQLRRLFEPELSPRETGSYIAASSTGYRLDPTQIRTDLDECDTAVTAARRLAERGQQDAAAEHYLAALHLVQGPLLGDVSLEGARYPRFSAVGRTRVAVAEEALAGAAATDRLAEVVALVEQVARPLPFEESLQAALVRALALTGRRRDALGLYDQVSTGLSEELGLEPGPDLRQAYDEVRAAEGDRQPTTTPLSAGGAPVRPAQLPAPLRGMTARPEAQAVLDEAARLGALLVARTRAYPLSLARRHTDD